MSKERFVLNHSDLIFSLNQNTLVMMTDLNGLVVYANPLFCESFGYKSEELIGKSQNQFRSAFHKKSFWLQIWKTVNQGGTWKGEIKNTNKNGETFWIYSIISPHQNEDGKIIGYLSLSFDIQKRKSLEEQLAEEQRNTLHLEKLAELGEISSGLTHEINNPLTVVNGNLALLKRKLGITQNSPEDILKHFIAIEQNVSRIINLVKSFRRFIHKDSSSDTRSMNSISCIVGNSLSLLSEKFRENQVKIETIYSDEQLYCDSGQIEQVLVNFLVNSLYAIKNNDEKWIRIEVKKDDSWYEFSVTDSGHGIPEEIQAKLMKAFFTTKPSGQGTGLGLNISKKIIDSHQGQIFYDSKSPHTRFVFKLPVTAPKNLESAA
ncbi:MAG: ATP-binding protein [Bdellovibrionia bacterium]